MSLEFKLNVLYTDLCEHMDEVYILEKCALNIENAENILNKLKTIVSELKEFEVLDESFELERLEKLNTPSP
jgi:hypothetical protein